MSDGFAARKAAFSLIRAAAERGDMLSDDGLGALAPPDRARALSLAREAMRWAGSADRAVATHAKRAPKGAARDILRLGAAEMKAMGGAPHGVVDAMVRLAKGGRDTGRAAGMVNAVLRRIAEDDGWDRLDHARLALPDWLFKALKTDWGRPAALRIGAAHLRGAPLDLTVRVGAEAPEGAPTPTGSLRVAAPGRVSALAGFDAGGWWAQDAAAALPARLAGPGDGRRALDLCAAPGGKTMQLAAAGWRVTALDVAAERMETLRENLARTGLTAETVVADALDWRGGPFDLVLLDAPCSATGTIRRHPELPHIRSADIGETAALQRRLMDAAWALTAPGGAMIFCTCSLLRAEGEDQARAFLAAHPDAAREPVAAEEAGDKQLVDSAGDLRTRPDFWPEIGGMDGFFATRLRRAL